MKIKYFLFCCLSVVITGLHAQDTSLYKRGTFTTISGSMPYRILLPVNYDALKKYPLILFLHGSGERGNDNEKQLVHCSGLFLRDSIRKNYPAIVLFPQCPQESYWSNVYRSLDSLGKTDYTFRPGGDPTIAMVLVQELLQQIIEDYPVNKKQIYVGGLSMGGMGTYEIVRRNPKLFAAAFPICGGADPSTVNKLKKVSWWVFHGAKDEEVMPEFSQKMVAALQQANAAVKFTLYPEANHNSWDNAFAEPTLLAWLFSKSK